MAAGLIGKNIYYSVFLFRVGKSCKIVSPQICIGCKVLKNYKSDDTSLAVVPTLSSTDCGNVSGQKC